MLSVMVSSLSGCVSSTDADKLAGDASTPGRSVDSGTTSGGSNSGGSSGGGSNVAIPTLVVVGGDLQTVSINNQASSSLVVLARDKDGVPISNLAVTFGISGPGSISANSGVTNSSGIASVDFTANSTTGNVIVTATSDIGTVNFTLNVVALAGYTIQVVSGNSLSGTIGLNLGTPLQARVFDNGGNPATNIPVIFQVQTGNGNISGATIQVLNTDTSGYVNANFTLGVTAGANVVRASLANNSTIYTTFSNTGTVPANSAVDYNNSQITLSQNTSQANGTQIITVTVSLKDTFNNLIPNSGHSVGVAFSPVTGYGSWVSSSTFNYASSGTYVNSFKVGTLAGIVLFSAEVNGIPLNSGVSILTLNTGNTTGSGGASLLIVSGNSQTVGFNQTAPSVLKVIALDSLGIPIQGSAVNFTVSSGTGSVDGLSSIVVNTGADGTAQVTFSDATSAGTSVVSASSLQGAVAFSITVQDLTGYNVTAVGGNSQTGYLNSALTPMSVQVTQPGGNPAPNMNIRFQCQSANCGTFTNGLTSIDLTTDVNGLVNATYSLGTTPGNYTVRAIIPSQGTLYTDFTATAGVNPNSAISLSQSTLAISSNSVTANGIDSITATITARDMYGNTIPNSLLTVAATPNPTTLGNWIGVGFSASSPGVYVRTYAVGTQAGSVSFTGSIGGASLTSGASTLSINANSPPDLNQTTISALNSSLTADGSSNTTIVVTLYDQFGNHISQSGYSIVLATNTGTLSGGTMTYHGATGTYRQTFIAPTSVGAGTATISVSSVNGDGVVGKSTDITLNAGAISLTNSSVVIPSRMVSAINTAQTILVYLRDSSNNLVNLSPAPTLTATLTAVAGTQRGVLSNSGNLTFVSTGIYSVNLTSPASVTGCTATPFCVDSIDVKITHPSVNAGVATSIGTAKKVQWGMVSTLGNPSGVLTMSTTTAASGVGASSLTATLQLRNTSAQNIQVGGQSASISVSTTFSTPTIGITDNDNGTYTITIPSPASGSTGTLTVTAGGNAVTNGTQTITFYGAPFPANSVLTISSASLSGPGSITATLKLKDANGVFIPDLVLSDTDVQFLEDGETTWTSAISASVISSQATYTQQLTRAVSPEIDFESVNITAQIRIDGVWYNAGATQGLTITPENLAGVTINCTNIATYQNKNIYVAAGTLIMDSWENGAQPTSGGCAGLGSSPFTFNKVVIGAGGVLTHTAGTNTLARGIDIDVTKTFEIQAGGQVNLDKKGLNTTCQACCGSAGAMYFDGTSVVNSGTSVAGYGGPSTTGFYFGIPSEPNAPGASGGTCNMNGGGLIRVIAKNIINNGIITADATGSTSSYQWNGSGGGIRLEARSGGTVSGTGTFRARGGTGYNNHPGGGRIAIHGESEGLSLSKFTTTAGATHGTLYFTHPLSEYTTAQDLTINPTVANTSVIPMNSSSDLTVSIGNTFTMSQIGTTHTMGDVTVIGTLLINSPATVESLTVNSGGIIVHTPLNSTHGAPLRPRIDFTSNGDITVNAGGSITAYARGFPARGSPVNPHTCATNSGTRPNTTDGGGFVCETTAAGRGGSHSVAGGNNAIAFFWGSAANPLTYGGGGSSSAASNSGAGGGVIKLSAVNLILNGTISTAGESLAGSTANSIGAGAGGSINIYVTNDFSSPLNSGVVTANGGYATNVTGTAHGGAGGLVKIVRATTSGTISITSDGADGHNGGSAGTSTTPLITTP